ncbi:MAG TPA: ASKHA domain-containing protein [Bacillota bacterium]|nr:ASKHA domain-containing protein [Bacillota bacterium]
MAKVHFFPADVSVEAERGTTILQAALKAGVVLESPCNGEGTCGKCKVRLQSQYLSCIVEEGDHHRLSAAEKAAGFVLSCQARIQDDLEVEVVPQQKNHTLQILSKGKSLDVELSGLIDKVYDGESQTTQIWAGDELLGSEKGDTTQQNFGVVVDIGTTTLVASLIDINKGEELETASSLNPQSLHAQDVLSRIKLASAEEGLELMYSGVITEINSLIAQVARKAGVELHNVYEVIFSGNTCMLHLATGVNPESLGKHPYIPQVRGGNHVGAAEHGLKIADFGLIYLPPIVSAYVGADITSGMLAADIKEQEGVTLFVDIGTNGEMVIGVNGKLAATSTAAGPAFEGMNITHGMRAGHGAVELFEIGPEGQIKIETIGNAPAVGICGSGLLDIVGELVAHGVINKTGRYVDPSRTDLPESLKERLVKKEGKPVFIIAPNVWLTQKDVRQVQLAKGAVRAGIEFLLQASEISAEQVDRVLIAGSFGYHLRAKSLLNIGMLPREFDGKIDFVGNTSKTGGEALLLNTDCRDKISDIVADIEVLDLAGYENFDRVFVDCLGF